MSEEVAIVGYAGLLGVIKAEVRESRLRATRTVNTELVRLYWRIGRRILDQQEQQGWGTKVIERLSADLRSEFPEMTGMSTSNLQYMRTFASRWSEDPISPQPVGKLPWGHIRTLLDKVKSAEDLGWYATRAAEHGWSRKVLEHHLSTDLQARLGSAPTNFAGLLEPADSDLAREIVKDPYVFDFLDLSERAAERELEQSLMDRLQDTLTELGRGFAFVGRQVQFDVDGDEFFVDLLFFHTEQLRYVVVELKIGKFRASDAGQLGLYVAIVDDELRRPQHAPTVGILLCASRNERVVRYALRTTSAPMAVATYTYDKLPAAERAALLPVELLSQALDLQD